MWGRGGRSPWGPEAACGWLRAFGWEQRVDSSQLLNTLNQFLFFKMCGPRRKRPGALLWNILPGGVRRKGRPGGQRSPRLFRVPGSRPALACPAPQGPPRPATSLPVRWGRSRDHPAQEPRCLPPLTLPEGAAPPPPAAPPGSAQRPCWPRDGNEAATASEKGKKLEIGWKGLLRLGV